MASVRKAITFLFMDYNNMSGELKTMFTSVCALVREDGSVLVVQRPLDKKYGGYWEFPGGRQDNDETPVQIIIRELKEELGIRVDPKHLNCLGQIDHEYEDLGLRVRCSVFLCRQWEGTITLCEGQPAMKWADLAELKEMSDQIVPGDRKRIDLIAQHLTPGS